MSFYIIIRGPLGCGKSTVSEYLSQRIGAEHISIDRILDDVQKDWEEGYISQKSFIAANEQVIPRAKELLEHGVPVIFDGNFYWKSQIEDLISKLPYPHYIFTLTAPLNVCIDRDREREKTHGEDAVRVVYKKSTEFTYGIEIDVTKRLDDCVEEIISHIKTGK